MPRGFSDALQSLMGFYARKELRSMLGRPLSSVVLSDDKEFITFHFEDGGTQSFTVEGDCCSSSWIEHMEAPGDIRGATITDITQSGMEEEDEGEDREYYIKVYNTRFVTDRGEIVLEYRNSSNGYYGGYLVAVSQ